MFSPDRRRFIFESWPRDPKGPFLKKPPPDGKRPPNGLIWGADLDSFFWTQRAPGRNVMYVWTRSMIQEFGENFYKLEEIDEFEPDPCLVLPYPVLCKYDVSVMDVDDEPSDEHNTSGELAGPSAITSSNFTFTVSFSDTSKHPFDDLPKLEEFIPEEYFPDVLMVHDPDNLTPGKHKAPSTGSTKYSSGPGIEYKRLWPTFASNITGGSGTAAATAKPRVAHLHLSAGSRIGVGHHSLVYRSALTLPPPLTADSSTGQVTVAAKLVFPGDSAREMLRNEADIYNKFPKHLMEDWCGYNLVTPHKHPVPVDAVVPKFFGYYVPVVPPDSSTRYGLSPILLLEECGIPIDTADLSKDEQSQCYTHILRLHYADFMQNSIYVRNIMVQPGPLSVAPSERSLDQPSFRIIDFGRGERFDDWLEWDSGKKLSEMKGEEISRMVDEWNTKKMMQENAARGELDIDLFEA